MPLVGQSLVVLTGVILVWTYLLYPLLIARMARRAGGSTEYPVELPTLTVFIAARNEAQTVRARVESLIAQDYPPERLRIVLVSDGSSDGTTEAVDGMGIEVSHHADGPGKSEALTRAVEAHSFGEILVLTDATSRFDPNGLRELLRPFADLEIGATSGRVRYEYPPASAVADGFMAYQKRIVPHRKAESTVGALLSVSGAMCAVRRELWCPPPADVTTDLSIPMAVAAAGKRALATSASCLELARASSRAELQSRIRQGMGAGGFIRLLRQRWATLPGRYRFGVVSHKVLRWWSPFLMLSCTLGLVLAGMWMGLALVGLAAIFALCGLLPRVGPYFGIWLFAATVLLGTGIGLVKYLFGHRAVSWEPADQR